MYMENQKLSNKRIFLFSLLILCLLANFIIFSLNAEARYSYVNQNRKSDNGVCEVYTKEKDGVYLYSCVDEEGNLILPLEKGNGYISNTNGYILVGKTGMRESLILNYHIEDLTTQVLNAKGERVTSFDIPLIWYDGINGISVQKMPNGEIKYALTDQNATLITRYDYNYLKQASIGADIFKVTKNGLSGFLNRGGEEIVSTSLCEVRKYYSPETKKASDYYNVTNREGLMGLVDIDGDVVIKPNYEIISPCFEGFCSVYDDKSAKYAIFDTNGRNRTGFVYDKVGDFSEGYAQIYVNGKWGYIDKNMRIAIEPIYMQSSAFKNGYAKVIHGTTEEYLESPIKQTRDINIYVDDNWLYSENEPFIKNSRTLVPIRMVAESMGYAVMWKADKREVVIQNDKVIIHVFIDNKEATVNIFNDGIPPEIVTMDVAPTILEGRTYLPLRFVAESFGAQVEWEDKTRTINISSAIN